MVYGLSVDSTPLPNELKMGCPGLSWNGKRQPASKLPLAEAQLVPYAVRAMDGPAPLQFDEIVTRLRRLKLPVGGPALSIPTRSHPFVPQTVNPEQWPPASSPLDSDVLLITAPAAVGKSTFARALAATVHVPLLNLAEVPVSTHSLRGIVAAEIGPDAPKLLQQGEFSLIVDALDEGRVLSTDKNFVEFLKTSFTFLAEGTSTGKGKGPKLILFGRTEAVEDASIVLELEAPSLPASRLTLDYFDEKTATQLVLDYAATVPGASDKLQRYDIPIREAIASFFDAIAAAIGFSRIKLWQDRQGQSFAGYAPVLAALGALVAQTENYTHLKHRLQATGATDAWDVLEQVATEVLEREASRVRRPLTSAGHAIPDETYDPIDQLDHLVRHLVGQPFRVPSRIVFESPSILASYRDAVRTYLPEHPFFRAGAPVNDVLGALVLAHAIAGGVEISAGQAPRLMSTYGRQPFLWRFLRRRLIPRTLIAGDVVSYILGSLWSDETAGETIVSVSTDAHAPARLRIAKLGHTLEADIAPPLVLRQEVRDLEVELPDESVIIAGWPGSGSQTIRFLGQARLTSNTMRFEVDRIHIGALGIATSLHLSASHVENDQRLTVQVQDNSILVAEGAFEHRYPWEGVASRVPPPPPTPTLRSLLVDCARRFPHGIPVVVFQDYSVPGGPTDWARRYGDLLPRLLRALVDQRLATAERFEAAGAPKIRVRPQGFVWQMLVLWYDDLSKADSRFGEVIRQLQATH